LSSTIFGRAEVRSARAAEPEIHYAPVENLEHIDLALIRSATKSADMAAFTLTDWAIIATLQEAHARGVTIRILLDPSQRQDYRKLAGMADVVRVKKRGRCRRAGIYGTGRCSCVVMKLRLGVFHAGECRSCGV
jgi:phosphatidylserine/phosphatidylglycerophosphate/cardiolipin synthase-like enzyme